MRNENNTNNKNLLNHLILNGIKMTNYTYEKKKILLRIDER